jgi:hypothetical protein
MKSICWAVVATFALLLAVRASAQDTPVTTNVPFDFIINGATIPAGKYTIQRVDNQGKVLSIRSLAGRSVSTFMANYKRSAGPCPQTKLVFHSYGDRYFLAEIWVRGELTGRQIPTSAREKEMARNGLEHLYVADGVSIAD